MVPVQRDPDIHGHATDVIVREPVTVDLVLQVAEPTHPEENSEWSTYYVVDPGAKVQMPRLGPERKDRLPFKI